MTTIRLTGRDINSDNVSCTVEQILLVLRELLLACDQPGLVWYGADFSPAVGALEPYRTQSISKIGTGEELLSLLSGLRVSQIDFGLLIAILKSDVPPKLGTTFSAEGPSGQRYIASVIELLAFDSTCIEVTSGQDRIWHKLRERFPSASLVDPQDHHAPPV